MLEEADLTEEILNLNNNDKLITPSSGVVEGVPVAGVPTPTTFGSGSGEEGSGYSSSSSSSSLSNGGDYDLTRGGSIDIDGGTTPVRVESGLVPVVKTNTPITNGGGTNGTQVADSGNAIC